MREEEGLLPVPLLLLLLGLFLENGTRMRKLQEDAAAIDDDDDVLLPSILLLVPVSE